ncbi:MAG: glycosyltransferase family 1 protein [Caulobacterales bacterium]
MNGVEGNARAAQFIINGRFLAKPLTGVTRVGRELLRALVDEIDTQGGGNLRLAMPQGGVRVWDQNKSIPLGPGWGDNIGEQFVMPFYYPSQTIVGFCNTAPFLARRAIIWIHDSHVFDAPDTFSPMYRRWHQAVFRVSLMRRFDIVTVSEFSRERLIALGADPARIRVIYNGGDHLLREEYDESALKQAGVEGARYVLIVGSRAKHKNIPFAVDALSRALPADVKIVIGGLQQVGPYGEAPATRADPRIVRLPFVTDGQMRAFYRNAECLVLPSLLEGFGLPAAEAMWEGAPLVLSNRGSLPEVGGAAALYFDGLDAADIAAKTMQALQPETNARLREAANQQREKFSWQTAAREFLSGYLGAPAQNRSF